MTQKTRVSVANNLSWFLASVALAFMVWIVATIQSDPITQQTFNNIPMQIDLPENFILTQNPKTSVRVIVRGQRSVISLLTAEDIVVKADLVGRPVGLQTVPLVATINRQGVFTVDTQPTQLTVTMEQIESVQKPVEMIILNAPPVDFAYDTPLTDVVQAQVSGATSQLADVVEVRGELDLSAQRNPYETDVSLVPIDVNGRRVSDVTVEPRNTHVTVNIYARDDVRQVSVRPNILLNTLENGYVLTSISYEPQVIYLSGSQTNLQAIGSTIDTEEISLSGHFANFVMQARLDIPTGLLILDETNTVTVTLGISAQNSVRQVDNVPVNIIGLAQNLRASLTPDTISVVLTGPINTLNAIQDGDVKAVVDLNNLSVGNSEVIPHILIGQGEITLESNPLPAVINVSIGEPTPETTPETTPIP